jgi:hypothetical protein
MADATEARNTKRKLSPYDMRHTLPLSSAAGTIYQGTQVGVNASGDAVKASDALCIQIVGRCAKTVTYSATGDTKVDVDSGIFCYGNASAAAALALANGDRFQPAYVLDDSNVTNDPASLFAGFVQDIDSDGVYVLQTPFNKAP